MASVEVGGFPDTVDVRTWLNPEYLNFQRPEIARFLGSLTFDPRITNTITSKGEARGLLADGGFVRGAELDLPIVDGIIDPPRLSEVATERIAERDEPLLPGLSEFRYRYATVNGATEGIDQLMVGLSTNNTMKKAGLLRGDYLGYYGAACCKGIEVQWTDSLQAVGEPDDLDLQRGALPECPSVAPRAARLQRSRSHVRPSLRCQQTAFLGLDLDHRPPVLPTTARRNRLPQHPDGGIARLRQLRVLKLYRAALVLYLPYIHLPIAKQR